MVENCSRVKIIGSALFSNETTHHAAIQTFRLKGDSFYGPEDFGPARITSATTDISVNNTHVQRIGLLRITKETFQYSICAVKSDMMTLKTVTVFHVLKWDLKILKQSHDKYKLVCLTRLVQKITCHTSFNLH